MTHPAATLYPITPYLEELGPLGAAFLLGLGVALLRLRLRGAAGRDGLAWVLVVLAPLMCLVVRAIEGDLARAFGLVGILALVRFRTPMRDPADAVFVLVSVAAGVVVAARADLLVAAMAVVTLGLGAWFAHTLIVRAGAAAPQHLVEVRLRCAAGSVEAVERCLQGACTVVRVVRAEVGGAGSPVDLRYQVALAQPAGLATLCGALGAVPGVERASARGAPRA